MILCFCTVFSGCRKQDRDFILEKEGEEAVSEEALSQEEKPEISKTPSVTEAETLPSVTEMPEEIFVDVCGSSFGHPGLLGLEVTRLINRRIQSGKCKQFARCREAMDIANLTKYHPAIGSPNARDGHDHRVEAGDKVCHFKLCME